MYAFEDVEIYLERFECGATANRGYWARAFDVRLSIRHRESAVSKNSLVSNVWGVVALSAAAVPTYGEVLRALGDSGGHEV